MDNNIAVKPGLFGIFERFTAGFCMAIPVFVIIADQGPTKLKFFWLAATFILVLALPFITRWALKKVAKKNHGFWISLASLALLGVFWGICVFKEIYVRDTISAYVQMDDRHIFGMLLTIAAMLFIANYAVYWAEKQGPRFKWINLWLGLLLFGVISFRCDEMYVLHMICAISFFVLCTLGTALRTKGDGPRLKSRTKGEGSRLNSRTKEYLAKRRIHFIVDLVPVVVIAGVTAWWFFTKEEPPPGLPCSTGRTEWITLFGVESLALWIVGADFILISMKRGRKTKDYNPKAVEAERNKDHSIAGEPNRYVLNVGEEVMITVPAAFWHSPQSICVAHKEVYKITCDVNQQWTDFIFRTNPNGYSNRISNLMKRRLRDENCFCLCGVFDQDDMTGFAIGGKEVEKTIDRNGDLSFFANDAWLLYWNNFGKIEVKVRRVK